jgi:protein-L-isoaspartate(D-aspartate) O-methyltransferase
MAVEVMDMTMRRRFFAEEIEAVARLRSPALVDALAAVAREAFLPPGPWTALAEVDFMSGAMRPAVTPDADPKRLYHNIGIAIDPSRQLFNGQPGTLAAWIDALSLEPGGRVLHVGAGLGYYTAVMAHCVGATGRIVAYEVDEALAASARRNLAAFPWVELRAADASEPIGETFDSILVNAGVTHPLPTWLDALAPRGCVVLPLTTSMAPMGATLGKGLTWFINGDGAGGFSARVLGVVSIYTAVGIRNEALSQRIGAAMMAGPMKWHAVKRLRRDPHDETGTCWIHADGFCLSG